MRFLPYQPDQGYLLPPSVADVLGPDHLCFFLRRIVERLDLSAFEKDYSEEGQPGYHPALMVSVWLYAYALGITSSRRLEQRIREDLPLRYWAGGAQPDFWTLNAFRRRHPQALNDLFTHVVELAQAAGLGRLGHVAIDSSRVAASASPDRVDSRKKLRAERARIRRQIRRWQRAANAEDPNEQGGMALEAEQQRVLEKLEQRLQGLPGRLQELKKSQLEKRSRTDPDSRFLHQRGKFVLGYTATLASSEDHLILEQRVGQNSTDYESLVPMVEGVRERCGERPQKVSADSGFFTLPNVHALEAQGIDLYLPDPVLAKELNTGRRVQGAAPVRDPAQRSMRRKLRHRVGRAIYQQRKATIEPIFGVLKEQRGLRRFRLRGLAKVGIELALACTAYNITRMWRTAREETAQA